MTASSQQTADSAEATPRAHASWRSVVLLSVVWTCMLTFLTPLSAIAQVVGLTPAPELSAAFSFWELVKQGGSLGIAAIAGWWALRKDKEAKEAMTARIVDSKEVAKEQREVVQTMTVAVIKMETAISGLTKAVEALDRRKGD